MDLKLPVILTIIVGSILIASMLPTALNAIYRTNSNTFRQQVNGTYDANGVAIVANMNASLDSATAAVWNLLPLFAALAAMGVLLAVGLKEFGYI